MILSNFIETTKASVLNQLNLSDISILSFTNIGLLELHKQFNLNIKRHTITVVDESIIDYAIPKDVMEVLSVKTLDKYFKDYKGKLLTTSSTESSYMHINVEDSPNSIYTEMYGFITYLYPTLGQELFLRYKASPVELTFADLNLDIPLPEQYIEALLMYVAYLSHLTYGGEQQESAAYLNRFNFAKEQIRVLGLTTKPTTLNTALAAKGFR